MRYGPERQFVFDDTIEDFFLLPAPSLSNRPLHLPDLMGSGKRTS
ncbi:hypothetical protein [Borrelia sp. RT5S]|nr:hypothetical protein [Borrelia sp. RT5S]